MNRPSNDGASEKVGITIDPSEIIGKIVFWIIMLTFIISASETLGLEKVSKFLQ